MFYIQFYSGFDINRQLKHVEMGVWSQSNCNSSDHYRGAISSRMMCAWNDRNDWGPCFVRLIIILTISLWPQAYPFFSFQNDEGAPLMCHSPRLGRWYLAGVLTSHNCGAAKHPAVYADVNSLQSWIRNTIGLT